LPNAGELDVKILATDLDPNMVAHGDAALYTKAAVDGLTADQLKTWFVREELAGKPAYRVADKARSLIRFNRLNLLSSWPMRERFDIIFCRNVMIYFDDETQISLCRRFHEKLLPGGVLYIGHSERVEDDTVSFELVGQTTYVKRPGGAG
jgi:chemotaxis protein methyltransferase CheR